MPSSYPGVTDTFVDPSGTSLLASVDHAGDHTALHSSVKAIQNTVGTTLGTALFGAFTASDKPLRVNGGTIQQTIAGGTFNSVMLGTPIVDTISARNAGTGIGFANSMYPAEGTIVDVAGGTFTVDARASQIYYSVMGTAAGNRTINTPTNLSPYQQLTYAFKSSGSANGTLVWGTIFRMSQDVGTPALGTGTSWNYYGWRYNSIDSKLDFMGQSLNVI